MRNIQTIARQAAISLITLIGVTSFTASTQAQIQKQGRARNVVIVHGAPVDGSGWKDVYDHLVRDGFVVTIVQDPQTSLADDVAATKHILDLQDGPTVLVGQSYRYTMCLL